METAQVIMSRKMEEQTGMFTEWKTSAVRPELTSGLSGKPGTEVVQDGGVHLQGIPEQVTLTRATASQLGVASWVEGN